MRITRVTRVFHTRQWMGSGWWMAIHGSILYDSHLPLVLKTTIDCANKNIWTMNPARVAACAHTHGTVWARCSAFCFKSRKKTDISPLSCYELLFATTAPRATTTRRSPRCRHRQQSSHLHRATYVSARSALPFDQPPARRPTHIASCCASRVCCSKASTFFFFALFFLFGLGLGGAQKVIAKTSTATHTHTPLVKSSRAAH